MCKEFLQELYSEMSNHFDFYCSGSCKLHQ